MKALLRRIALVAALVCTLPAALLLRCVNVRFIASRIDRVGHLALDIDCYVKEGRLGLHPRHRAVLLAPRDRVSNAHLSRYWRRHLRVIESPLACALLRPLSYSPLLHFDTARYATAINQTAQYPAIQAKWAGRAPLLSLDQHDVRRGERFLREQGVGPHDWFVCVHSREGGYSPHDENVHSYRNSDIASYRLAMAEIAARGGWCIRIGDPSMRRLPAMERTIDYAHHPQRADWLDVFLCARCLFFLGNTSGPYLMSSIFGVPVALANLLPLSAVLPFAQRDLGIPKLLADATGRPLPFGKIMDSPAGNFRFTSEYRRAGLTIIDNTPEEIRDLALEQLDRCRGAATYDDTDAFLQERFRHLFRPGHYAYGSLSRVGRDFLRAHRALLAT